MLSFLGDHVPAVAASAAVLVSTLVGLLVRHVLLRRLSRLAEGTAIQVDDAFLASLRRPLPIWFFLGGLAVGLRLLHTSPENTAVLEKVVVSAFVVSATLWAAGLASRVLKVGVTTPGSTGAPATGVMRHALRIIVLGVGVLVLLSTLGISVAPVLTTVGIGGVAVALGLQETLANLFAGMQITLAGNIRVGDFIKLESGEEGYVEDVHWRATRIRTLPNNVVVIPNSRLAQSVVTNYHLPSKDLAVLVQVGVHYASDLEQVERVTRDVGNEIMKSVAGGVPDFTPFIRYHTFNDSSIDFTVILRAQERTDEFLVKHEFMKALSRAFTHAGIVIPFPIQAINLEQEKASLPAPGTSHPRAGWAG